MRRILFWSLTLLLVAPASSPVLAQQQTSDSAPEDQESGSEQPASNWQGSLSLGGNFNLVSNEDVVGQSDGNSALVGLSVNGDADYRYQADEFRGTLVLNESFARTPTLDRFVKYNDQLTAEGIYNRYFLSWSGGFGRLAAETSIFENFSVTGSPRTYRLVYRDGREEARTDVQRLRLSDYFKPTSLDQSAGAFMIPVETTPLTVRTRLGLAARETFARGVFVLDDDPETAPVDAIELADIYQGGFEAFAGANGAFPDQNVTYEVGVTGLLPILNNDRRNRSALRLARVGFTGSLTFAAWDWLSANYNVQVTRDPQLIDATQIQHLVFLTLKYNLIERREETEPTPEEKLDEAQNRIDELETRIQELEKEKDGGGDEASEDSTEAESSESN